MGTLARLPMINRRKVGMTSNHHAPYVLGYTRTTMAVNRGTLYWEVTQIPKSSLSTDCRMKIACMNSELLVIADHHAPYDLGHTRTTMAVNRGTQYREVEQTPKNGPSSDCRLQLACMKSELLVIANQNVAVNTFPGLVHTARHTMRVGNTRSL